jgi:hypothetical protein
MSKNNFLTLLKEQSDILSQEDIENELKGILDNIELAGLAKRIKDSIHRLVNSLR